MSDAIAGVGAFFRRWNGAAFKDIAAIVRMANGMNRDTIDITSLDSIGGYREFIGGFRDGGEIVLEMVFLRETYDLMKVDFENDVPERYYIQLPDDDDTNISFTGLVNNLEIMVQTDDYIASQVAIKISSGVVVQSGQSTYPAILDDGNTVAWFDMVEASNMIVDGSNRISRATDLSGNGNHLLQADTNKQPLHSSGGGLFDGVDDFMDCVDFTLNQPAYFYAVLRQITWTDNDRIWDGGTNSISTFYQGGGPPTVRMNAGVLAALGGWTLNTYGFWQILYNGAASKRLLNHPADSVVNLGTNNPGGFTLGARSAGDASWSNIEVAGIIIRKSADSRANDTIIYDYMADRYSALLP